MWCLMHEGFPVDGPYEWPPSLDDEWIAEPIRRGVPEEVPGLAWNRPDFSATGHKLIKTFAFDRKQRPGGSFIRCAIFSNEYP